MKSWYISIKQGVLDILDLDTSENQAESIYDYLKHEIISEGDTTLLKLFQNFDDDYANVLNYLNKKIGE